MVSEAGEVGLADWTDADVIGDTVVSRATVVAYKVLVRSRSTKIQLESDRILTIGIMVSRSNHVGPIDRQSSHLIVELIQE